MKIMFPEVEDENNKNNNQIIDSIASNFAVSNSLYTGMKVMNLHSVVNKFYVFLINKRTPESDLCLTSLFVTTLVERLLKIKLIILTL